MKITIDPDEGKIIIFDNIIEFVLSGKFIYNKIKPISFYHIHTSSDESINELIGRCEILKEQLRDLKNGVTPSG